MEDILTKLYKIREMAMKREEIEQNIVKLRGGILEKQKLNKLKPANDDSIMIIAMVLGFLAANAVIFFIAVQVVARMSYLPIIGKVIDAIYFSAGRRSFLILIEVLALGITGILFYGIKKSMEPSLNKKNKKLQEVNDEIKRVNAGILEKNKKIEEHNIGILNEISSCENQIKELINSMRKIMPEIPEDYCRTKAINYLIKLLLEGKADNINKAMILYEMERI